MECYNHPDREAVTKCSMCGKDICQDCSMEIAGNVYCKDCVNKIVTQSIMEKAVQSTPQFTKEEINESKETNEVQEEIETKPKLESKTPEVVETITPLKPEEINEKKVPDAPKKPAENFEPEYEYETEYVETYDEDGVEDSYYENPEFIPEPEPEYREREQIQREKAAQEVQPENKQLRRNNQVNYIDEEEEYYYNEYDANNAPSNELEAKYEKYLEDLYYDNDERVEEVPVSPRQTRRGHPEPNNQEISRRHRNHPNQGGYRINPREEYYDDEDYIVPAHNRQRRDAESYEDLKRRIERNYAREQEAKENRRFRRSKKSKRPQRQEYSYEEFDNMPRYMDEDFEEDDKITITEIFLVIILVVLIILLILYVIYLFRLNGEYFSFLDSLQGLTHDPSGYLSNVLNFLTR